MDHIIERWEEVNCTEINLFFEQYVNEVNSLNFKKNERYNNYWNSLKKEEKFHNKALFSRKGGCQCATGTPL